MATQALQTVVSPDRIEVIISDHLDVDQAHVLVRISYRIQTDQNEALAVIQARALAAAREALSAEIQERTRVHGPVPR